MDNIVITILTKTQRPLRLEGGAGERSVAVLVWAGGVLGLGENKFSRFVVDRVFELVRRGRRAVQLGVEFVVMMAVFFVVTALRGVLALLALEKINLSSKQMDFLMVRQRLNQIHRGRV